MPFRPIPFFIFLASNPIPSSWYLRFSPCISDKRAIETFFAFAYLNVLLHNSWMILYIIIFCSYCNFSGSAPLYMLSLNAGFISMLPPPISSTMESFNPSTLIVGGARFLDSLLVSSSVFCMVLYAFSISLWFIVFFSFNNFKYRLRYTSIWPTPSCKSRPITSRWFSLEIFYWM